MAWYPGAKKMELQPESDAQPAIRPTQFIMHSIAAPWDEQRIYEYWRDSTNLESHFGLDYDGSIGQFIGTQTRADANYRANRRPDGTGAVSIETASNLHHTDAWTPEQIEQLIRLGLWLHQHHGIPLRICRTWDDPGYGYHRLYPEWSTGGTECPGDARVRQFHAVVFPGIVARATGKTSNQEDDMALTDAQAKQLADLHARLVPYAGWSYKGKDETRDAYAYLRGTSAAVQALTAQVAALSAVVTRLAEGGGLTAAEAQAAAEAGARKVLDDIAAASKGA
ncbi:peptidoglycan recognition protein family protein [Streptomyces actuosus]|uniref:peptidoglycan recognition protein family protein n=1 Tax=Streptomyces actuosus TaxID=1885 RepID=UPI001F05899E|nr:N-acetylmuramoyl-L-alanine amidase [Streptomyces actuosus]